MNSYRVIENHLSVKPFFIVRSLGAVALFLVVASVVGQLLVYLAGHDHVYGLVRLFYVDEERNIPTGFSSLLLLFASLLLAVLTGLERKRPDFFMFYWGLLAVGFLFMAGDEALSFHERLLEPMRGLLGDSSLGIFYFAWVIPYIVLTLILMLVFLRFLWRLPSQTMACVYYGRVLLCRRCHWRRDDRRLLCRIIRSIQFDVQYDCDG